MTSASFPSSYNYHQKRKLVKGKVLVLLYSNIPILLILEPRF